MPFTAPGVLIDVGDGTLIPVLPANTVPDATPNAAPVVTPIAAVTTPPLAPAATPSPPPSTPASLDTDALVPAGVSVPTGYLGLGVTLVPAPASAQPPAIRAPSPAPSTPSSLDTDALAPAGVTVPTGYLGQSVTLIPAPASPQPPANGASQTTTQPTPASAAPPQTLDTDALVPLGVHVPRGYLGDNVTLTPAPLVTPPDPRIQASPDDPDADALVAPGARVPRGYLGQNVTLVSAPAVTTAEGHPALGRPGPSVRGLSGGGPTGLRAEPRPFPEWLSAARDVVKMATPDPKEEAFAENFIRKYWSGPPFSGPTLRAVEAEYRRGGHPIPGTIYFEPRSSAVADFVVEANAIKKELASLPAGSRRAADLRSKLSAIAFVVYLVSSDSPYIHKGWLPNPLGRR